MCTFISCALKKFWKYTNKFKNIDQFLAIFYYCVFS